MVVPYGGGGTFRGGDAGFFNSPEFFELNTQINYRFQLTGDYSVNPIGLRPSFTTPAARAPSLSE